jgi:lambda repressor-like predicted transcriptional regulator
MRASTWHPEDIKAALRKQHGSVFAFEDAHGLPRKSVSDFLRGRRNQHVANVIDSVLTPKEADEAPADLSDDSDELVGAHRLNRAAH